MLQATSTLPQPEQLAPLRLLMLLTDAFGGHGGIAKFNRDFLEALDKTGNVDRTRALPRLILRTPLEEIPESVIYDRRAAKGKFSFIKRALYLGGLGNRFDVVICAHINLILPAVLAAKAQGARLALIMHGVEIWTPPRDPMARALAGKVDAAISVSRLSAQRFMAWSKLPSEKVSILPNCVDLDVFVPKQRDPELLRRYGLYSRKVIMTLGRLESKERFKGFDQVIAVLPRLRARFPDLVYLIVGDGPDRARLEELAKTTGVGDQVIFTGMISEDEKVAHYNLADAYVMPSVGEGFGIVLLEASACGTPIVGSNADGSREALLNGELGKLIDPTNLNELLDAVTAALVNGKRGQRNDAVETYSRQNFDARVHDWITAQAAERR